MHWSHKIARGTSKFGIGAAGFLGIMMLMSSCQNWVVSTRSDKTWAVERGRMAVFGATVSAWFIGYATCAAAVWRWPRSPVAIVLRVVFSLSGANFGTVFLVAILATPMPVGGCGQGFVAAMMFCAFLLGYSVVETASWIGWCQLRSQMALTQSSSEHKPACDHT